MKVKSLDGKSHSWNLGDYVGKHNTNCSALHDQARDFLTEKYPAILILEEVYLPGENLYLDFYLPAFSLAIECQGRQHDEYVGFFHRYNKFEFIKARARDKRKSSWCQLNNIKLIYFLPDESVEQWNSKL